MDTSDDVGWELIASSCETGLLHFLAMIRTSHMVRLMRPNSIEEAKKFGTEIERGTFGPKRSFPLSYGGKRHGTEAFRPALMKCWNCRVSLLDYDVILSPNPSRLLEHAVSSYLSKAWILKQMVSRKSHWIWVLPLPLSLRKDWKTRLCWL